MEAATWVYLCWRSFSANGSSGWSFTTSAVFPFFSVDFTAGFLGAISGGGFTTGAWSNYIKKPQITDQEPTYINNNTLHPTLFLLLHINIE